jgi:hypothetical protein
MHKGNYSVIELQSDLRKRRTNFRNSESAQKLLMKSEKSRTCLPLAKIFVRVSFACSYCLLSEAALRFKASVLIFTTEEENLQAETFFVLKAADVILR